MLRVLPDTSRTGQHPWHPDGQATRHGCIATATAYFPCWDPMPGRNALPLHVDLTAIVNTNRAGAGQPIAQFRHMFGPLTCTESPVASTATVTGMSLISNS